MPVRRLIVLALVVTASVVAAPASAEPDLTITAHRGAPTRTLGENTLPAFGRAIADGATGIETDLRRTKDDKLVVLHDSGVGRTTNCAGPIGSWTLRDLTRKCRERTTRQPLLTARELLKWADHTGASLMIELKGSGWSVAQIREVVNLLRSRDILDQVAISSLRLSVLERVQRLKPNLATQFIVTGWAKVRASQGRVKGYNIPSSVLTKSRVEGLQRKGIRVLGAYSDSRGEWRRLRKFKVDGVVVPSVRAYSEWAGLGRRSG